MLRTEMKVGTNSIQGHDAGHVNFDFLRLKPNATLLSDNLIVGSFSVAIFLVRAFVRENTRDIDRGVEFDALQKAAQFWVSTYHLNLSLR